MPEGDPDIILEDLALDGVDVGVMHPNLSLFGLYSDDHELSIAHARVYNDYIMERFTPYFSRLAPTAPIPLSDVDDAVAEIERVAAGGFRAILLPAVPPRPYYSRDFDPVWAAAQANRVHVFIHTQTGGVKVNDPEATTLKVVMENAEQVNQPMTEKAAAKRMITQSIYSTIVPQQVICQLIGGGVPERYPDLQPGAVSANIDAKYERRVDANAETGTTDPSLMPLHIVAPNINGEDESQAPMPGDGNRTGNLSVVNRSHSIANRGRNPSPNLSRPISRSPESFVRRQSLAIHSSNTKLPLSNSSSHPTLTLSTSSNRKRMRGSSVAGRRRTFYPQEPYRRGCTKMYLDELECMANSKRRHSLSGQHDTALSSQKSLVFLR